MYKTLFGCIYNFIIYALINHNTKNKNYKHKPYEKRVREDKCVLKPVNLPPRIWRKCHTTFSNGCLGSHNDEERSEMRYVMRIAISSESSKLWTQLALLRKYVCWSVCLSPPQNQVCLWSRYSGLLIVLWLSDREQIDLDENLDKTDLVFSLFFTAWRQNPSQQNPEKRRDVKLKSCLKTFLVFWNYKVN